jgi:hypothetical protein
MPSRVVSTASSTPSGSESTARRPTRCAAAAWRTAAAAASTAASTASEAAWAASAAAWATSEAACAADSSATCAASAAAERTARGSMTAVTAASETGLTKDTVDEEDGAVAASEGVVEDIRFTIGSVCEPPCDEPSPSRTRHQGPPRTATRFPSSAASRWSNSNAQSRERAGRFSSGALSTHADEPAKVGRVGSGHRVTRMGL